MKEEAMASSLDRPYSIATVRTRALRGTSALRGERAVVGERLTSLRLSRRRWLLVAAGAAGAMLAACQAAAPPAPTAVPAKPTEAPKPAASPAASPGASPAASPSPAAAAPAAQSAAAAATKPAAMTPVSQVMNWFAQSSMGGFFAALKNGDYERLNLQMTIEQGGPGVSSIPTVASGKYTLGMAPADQLFLARQEGIPVVSLFATFQTNPQGLMFHKSHPVSDFKDLNGRRLYVSPNGVYWLYFKKKFNLDQVEELTYRGQLATFLADETAVTQCFVGDEPLAAEKQGFSVGALLNADSGYNPYGNVMFAMEQTVKDKPDLVQAYVIASLQGWKSYADKPEPILAFIKEYNKDYDIDLAAKTAQVEKPLLTGRSYDPKLLGMMTEQRWKELHDQMREVGGLKSDLDVKSVFDSRFIEAAQKG